MGIKELVNAFNLNSCACDKVSTNFTVEDKKIVSLFAGDVNIREYLRRMEKEIIGRHYGTREMASEYYNLNCFPFVSGANYDKEYLDNGIVKVKLADSTDPAVIHNLKVHFASEFKRTVRSKVATCLQKEVGISEEEAYNWVNKTVGTGTIGKPYLYCIAFSNRYLRREYDLETFEFFKQAYIKEFNSKLESCGLKSLNFYECKDDVLYIKDVSDKVVRSVAECVKRRLVLYFLTPGIQDSKVENFKDVLSDLIFNLAGKSIYAYEHDVFTDKKKIENGNDFALIPLIKRYSGQIESLNHKDVCRINAKYKNLMSDIRGKTANQQYASCKEPVYAFSNKHIALLLPKIMESPIAYNQISGRFEFAFALKNFKECGSSRFCSTVASPFNFPTREEPLRTPLRRGRENRDSGIGESPAIHDSSISAPRSFFQQPQTQESFTYSQSEELEDSPRQELLCSHVNLGGMSEVFLPQNVPAGFNLRPQIRPPSWDRVNKNVRTEKGICSVPLSYFSGVEDVNNVRPEKQQVSDDDHNECSEAKPKGSKSTKECGGGVQIVKNLLSSIFKRRHDASINRDDVCRITTRSVPTTYVAIKPPVLNRFFSLPIRIRTKSKPPSGADSPTHEGALGGLKPLTSDERKELHPLLSPEQQRELDYNSFLPGEDQHLHLTHIPSRKGELGRSLYEGEKLQSLRLTEVQLSSPDNLSSKKGNRCYGYLSGFSASTPMPREESVSSKVEECSAQHMLEALKK